jgi:hypothetical protein
MDVTQVAHLVRMRLWRCYSGGMEVARGDGQEINPVQRVDLRWTEQVLRLVVWGLEAGELPG